MAATDMIDPATVTIILNAARLGHGIAKSHSVDTRLSTIQSAIAELQKRSDKSITRELLSAYEALYDAVTSTNIDTKKKRLEYAEEKITLKYQT